MTEKEIAWNLFQIFPSINDPSIDKAIEAVKKLADKIVSKYKGKIKDLDAKGLFELLQQYEEFSMELQDIGLFARLSFAANMTLDETQSLNDRVAKISAGLGQQLAFLDLDVGKLVFEHSDFISSKELANYKHYLERLNRRVPHQLSEVEEQLIIEKDQYGVRAWAQLQSKWLNTRKMEVEVNGEKKILSYGEVNGLIPNPDRATRESANKAIYSLLGQDGEIFASAMRSIFNDWVNVTKRRKYDSEVHASLIANDTELEIIDSLLKTIDEGSVIYRKYLALKAKLLKLPKLGHHDIVAPLPNAPDIKYDWEKAKQLVTDAYSKFDEESWFKGQSAFILQTFSNTLANIYTLAHEMGHATHDYYFTREQTPLNTRIPMILAETASIFGELLLTDLLLSKAESKEEKIAIISRVLDGAGMAAFQVTARKWFEQDLYDAINNGEFLDYKTICKYWTKNRDRIYGDAVEWDDVMESEWTMKPHYYRPNFRFYNYPYVYGQLFVYALYQKYLDEGEAFVPKFKKALAAGSSMSPKEIGETLGLDVADPEFWKLGIKRFEYFVNEFEKLLK
ncbi:MAG: M3 family metallopeptidase [Candidatus Heimdallarchaeota archaeon]